MLKAQKKLTKRQLKEDKFVTFYFQVQDFLQEYGRQILYGVAAVIAIAVVAFIIRSKQQASEQSAIVELTKAKLKYFENDYEATIPILKNLLDQYGSTDSAKEGTYYLACAYFNIDNFVEAEKYFRSYIDDSSDDILAAAAMAGLAACMEEQESFSAAAKLYSDAAKKYSDSFMAPQYLYDAARCYVLGGEKAEAKQALNHLIDDYADSDFKGDAEIMLSEISS